MNSGIAGSASNLSLLIVHFRLRERLLDPTGWAKISSELSWIPTTGKRSIQNCFYNTIRSSNISCCNFLVGHLGVSEPVGLQLLAGGRTGLLWALRAFFGPFGPGWLCPNICLFSDLKQKNHFEFFVEIFKKLFSQKFGIGYSCCWMGEKITLSQTYLVGAGLLVANLLLANLLITSRPLSDLPPSPGPNVRTLETFLPLGHRRAHMK